MGRKAKDRIGQRYGKLVVVSRELAVSTKNAYWLCKCDCGNYCTVIGISLCKGDTKSCGCFKKEKVVSSEWHRRTGKSMTAKGCSELLYNEYKNNAYQRKLLFSLSLEVFKDLTSKDCYYCGVPPTTKYGRSRNKNADQYVYNGIDRKDNAIGYTEANCTPCCSVCNRAKQAMAFEDFLVWLDRIARFQQPIQIQLV